MAALEASLKEQVMKQLQALDEKLERDSQFTLLKLWAEDTVQSEVGLEEVSVRLDEALFSGKLYTPERLSWCQRVGIDRFGVFAELKVELILFKMRRISAGRFLMGSPESEQGHDEDEGPRHEVELTEGFWLCETPCTQALWKAVMGDNPSEFKSAERPVENVGWDDCQSFLQKLNERLPGLQAQLPTEAQWEYACRAGTTTSTYAGELEILGERNAPLLDSIAWYGGNSGVEFDIEEGYDSSDWQEKQYEHTKAGTRIVGQKVPNAWGLYDMLGNVDEWCAERLRDYGKGSVTDPVGPQDGGVRRVIRGGAWFHYAQGVRAANRGDYHRAYRNGDLGFRFSVMPGGSYGSMK